LIKLLMISGSPVENSSTELLLRRIAESIERAMAPSQGVESSYVQLNDLAFRPCQACGEAPEQDFCLFEDDLTEIYHKLAECDCLLFGSPVYFDSVSAQAKAFIDRCNCFRPPDYANSNLDHSFVKILTRQRPGAMVLIGGQRAWFEGARRVIAGFFKWVEVMNRGVLTYTSTDFHKKGMAAEDSAILTEADQLGVELAAAITENHSDD